MALERESWIRVSRGALAGIEGEVLREVNDDRLLIAVAASSEAGEFEVIPGAYLVIQAENLEQILHAPPRANTSSTSVRPTPRYRRSE